MGDIERARDEVEHFRKRIGMLREEIARIIVGHREVVDGDDAGGGEDRHLEVVDLLGFLALDGALDRPDSIALTRRIAQKYFGERMLVLNLGDGWEPLCRYLGVPVPDWAYPWANKSPQMAR